jgi:3-phenylpropionate/trans-cinnamate dioxygenase ferredoxin reductase subunit
VTQRAVVVGAGVAGLRTAEWLRAQGYGDEIVVVGDEPWRPYNRPPLSKEALAGELLHDLTHERLAFRVRKAAADVVWRLGTPVTRTDLARHRVELADGSALDYDALVAATGVTARRLRVPGPPPLATAGRHVIRTLEDAVALRAELRPGARVVVLGAGFIGCEVAATARTLGCEVDCVAIDPLPMIRPLGPMLAAELRRRHEVHGVRFHLSTGVTAFEGTRRVSGVVLTSGSVLPADLVVEALGSRPTVDWLDGNGFDLTDGVLTDGALRPLTTHPFIDHANPVDHDDRVTSRGSRTRGSGRAPGGSSTGACPPTPDAGRVRCWPRPCPATQRATPR